MQVSSTSAQIDTARTHGRTDSWPVLKVISGEIFSYMRFMSHNWSATKQRLHPQSVAEISRHSVLSGDMIRQCDVWVSPQGHRSVSVSRHFLLQTSPQCPCSCNRGNNKSSYDDDDVPCEHGSAETTVAEGSRNPVAGEMTAYFGTTVLE